MTERWNQAQACAQALAMRDALGVGDEQVLILVTTDQRFKYVVIAQHVFDSDAGREHADTAINAAVYDVVRQRTVTEDKGR